MRLARRSSLSDLVGTYAGRGLSYPELGATRDHLPSGYHHVSRRFDMGGGNHTFEQAALALRNWTMHRSAGLAVAADGPAEVGKTVVMGLGIGVVLVVPCRVVYVVDEPRRQGFGYGTVVGHPECGEEAFIVSVTDNGSVQLQITAFSRPGSPLVQLAGPIGRAIQARATSRYASGLMRAI